MVEYDQTSKSVRRKNIKKEKEMPSGAGMAVDTEQDVIAKKEQDFGAMDEDSVIHEKLGDTIVSAQTDDYSFQKDASVDQKDDKENPEVQRANSYAERRFQKKQYKQE